MSDQPQSDLAKVNLVKCLIPIVVGALIWFLPIRPEGVTPEAWQMFAIFVGTITGCILQPMPIGAVSMIGLTFVMLTGVVEMDVALSGFSSSSIWLIVMAFFISRGFIKTGLGSRIAYLFVKLFGKKTLGLTYALIGCDMVIAPATPSNTARAGGIMYPIIRSLSEAFDSRPDDGTRKKMGSYLMFSSFHGNIITSGMFITAIASNPLAQQFAAAEGIEMTWFGYFLAALVPGLVSFLVIPFVLFKLYPPEVKETPNAPKWAQDQLNDMGPMSPSEKWMLGVFGLALLLWVTETLTGIDATVTAFIALVVLLLSGVLTWTDVKNESGAWDTLTWFAVLVMMASQLNELGFIPWLSETIARSVQGFSWPVILVILLLAYHYSHYLFASATAHVSAMYAAFLGVALAAGVPGMLAAVTLTFAGNFFASTTHYSNGPAPILFGSGYVTQNEWWKLNAILAFFYFAIWIGGGSLWLTLIGMIH